LKQGNNIIEEYPPESYLLNIGIINEELSNSLSSSFTLCIQPLWKDTDVFNQIERRGMLSSSWLLNMTCLVILKQQQKKTLI